ncbi:uncharacterized protein [Apostichopus japonicus]|uniref:uncharacterized protein isoform X5 n=1 Tax=Stichopus japonicus TaxID=307972 RepID=UPI003AB51F38
MDSLLRKQNLLLQLLTFLTTILTITAQELVCPRSFNVEVLRGTDGATVDYNPPTPVGNFASLTNPPPPGSFFGVGDTTLIYSFSGPAGISGCEFTISVIEVSPCDTDPCRNGGLCFASSVTDFVCVCSGCFTGQTCEIVATQSCSNNPCSNGGVCRPFQDNCNRFFCDCAPCFFGEFCERRIDACDNHNCQNSGTCVASQTGCESYTCDCVGCFTGEFCEDAIPDPCSSRPCLNGGFCIRGTLSCSSFQCVCETGYSGERCQIAPFVVTNPCNSFPCENGGVCYQQGSGYVCLCPDGISGVNCRSVVTPSTDSCSNNPCRNSATCYNSYDSTSGPVYTSQYACVCSAGFGGQNCAQNLNFGGTDQCALVQRCQNDGECRNCYLSFSNRITDFCNCPVGFIGRYCSIVYFDPCRSDPCNNGGTCTPFFSYFTCQCRPSFSGVTCGNVADFVAPVVRNCPPSDITVTPSNQFQGYAIVSWTEPSAVDSTVFTSRSRDPGALYQLGTFFQVTYTFSDASGNVATCNFDVNVNPVNTPPSPPNCPNNIQPVTSFQGNFGQFVTWEDIDSCFDSEDGSVTPECNERNGDLFPVGQTTVRCICTDSAGATSECDFTIQVNPVNTPPSPPNCPNNIQPVTSFQGNFGQFVTWEDIDSCSDSEDGSITPECNEQSGDLFPVGQTTVRCTCTDSAGATSECEFTIQVNPVNTPPSPPTCPNIQPVTSFQGNVGQIVTWDIDSCLDSEDGSITPECNRQSGAFFPVGQTTVRCTCTDSAGATSECDFTFQVDPVNTPPPPPTCPNIQPVTSFQGNVGQIVTWDIGSCLDSEDGSITPECNEQSGAFFPVGQTIVRCTCTDSAGATSECDFTFQVDPVNTPPSPPNCPNIQPVTSFQGNFGQFVTWEDIGSCFDSEDGSITPECNEQSGDLFPVGQTTVRCTCTDSAGATSECDFGFTVEEFPVNTPPSPPTCPNIQPVTSFQGNFGQFVTWEDIDSCLDSEDGSITPECNERNGDLFPVGQTTVRCTCTDSAGATSECDFTIQVNSVNTPPSPPTCPNNIQPVTSFQGNVGQFVTWEDIGSCLDSEDGSITPECNEQSGDLFPVGQTTVRCTCTDSAGATSECDFGFTVEEFPVVPPDILDCPADRREVTAFDATTTQVFWTEPTASSSLGGNVRVERSHAPGDMFGFGETRVTYRFTDENSGETSVCTFLVIVSRGVNTPPSPPNCPNNIQPVTSFQGNFGQFVTWEDIDSCFDSEDGSVTPECNQQSGDLFPVGQTTVRCTCTDSAGATSQCDFTIQVNPVNTPPSPPNCPNNIQPVTSFQGNFGQFVTWEDIDSCFDSEDGSVTPECNEQSGDLFPVGQTTVRCTCTDSAGATSQCDFGFTVEEFPVNTPPSPPNCPNNIQPVTSFQGNFGQFVTWEDIGSCFDSEDGSVTPECNEQSGDLFPVGQTTVRCTCTDSAGATSQCDFGFTVEEFPVNTPPSPPNCPNNIQPVTSFQGNFGQFVTWEDIGSCFDSEDGSVTPECNEQSGDLFPVGQTTVRCTCIDSAGATSQCDFGFTVEEFPVPDFQPPTVIGCPSDIRLEAPCSDPSAQIFWAEPTATTSTGNTAVVLMLTHSSGLQFPSPSISDVEYTFLDPVNNLIATCTFSVTVVRAPNVPPSIDQCPPSERFDGQSTAFVPFTAPACSDTEDETFTSECDPPPPAFFQQGTNSVVCSCRDSCGGTSQCSFEVNVIPLVNMPPTVPVCPETQVAVGLLSSNGRNTLQWDLPRCGDQEDGLIIAACNPMPGDTFNPGTTSVTCTCTDSGGLVTTCRFDGTILPAENNPPSTPVCPSVQPVFSGQGNFGQDVEWQISNCFDIEDGSITPICSPRSGSLFPVGNSPVICTCSDQENLSRSCSLTVEVRAVNTPPDPPQCPPNPTGVSLQGNTGNILTWNIPSCRDAEDGSITSVCNPMSGDLFSLGETEVTCRCFDSGGLSSSCSFTGIIRAGNTRPSTPICPGTLMATALRNSNGNSLTWNIASCLDMEDGMIEPVCDMQSGDFFREGVTLVNCRCTDRSGLFSECNFNGIIFAAEPLVCSNVPAPLEVFVTPGQPDETLSWTGPTCNPSSATLTCSETPPVRVPTGTSRVVSCTCREGTDQVSCNSFAIAVTPTGPVVIDVLNCPTTDIAFLPSTLMDQVAVFWSEPFALSNTVDGLANVESQTHTPGDLFPIPSLTTVVYTFEDSGATGQCVFNIRVELPPRVTIVQPCPMDFTISADLGVTSIAVNWLPPSAVNEAGQSVQVSSQSHFPGANFPVPGTTTVTYIFSDRGASDTCNFRITTNTRFLPPTIIGCPRDFEVTTVSGNSAVITWPAVSAVTDNNQLAVVVSESHQSGNSFPLGTTRVILVFGHPNSPDLTAACMFTVTVLAPPDPPTLISCPMDMTERSTTGNPVSIFWPPPTAITAAGGLAVISTQTRQSGFAFPIGTETVSITLVDPVPFGLPVVCSFTVTILPPILPPTVTFCPDDITMTSFSGNGLAVNFPQPTARTQSGLLANVVSQSAFPGDTFPVGKTVVRYVFRDQQQPTSSQVECTFCIEISLVLPDPPVVINCPGIISSNSLNGGSISISWTEPSAISNDQQSDLVSQSHAPGNTFPVGDTDVTYTFADPINNAVTSNCLFTVRVFGPPTLISCPSDITEISPTGNSLVVSWPAPSAVTSSGALASVQSQTAFSGTPFVIGVTCVEIIFIDPQSGLIVVCTFKITILGPPRISGCPADQTVTSFQPFIAISWSPPTAVSSVGQTLSGSSSNTPGSNFPSPSSNPVTYTFTDPASGLSSECRFNIVVIRPPPPTVSGCPQDIVRSEVGVSTVVSWIPPTAVSDTNLPVPCQQNNQVGNTFAVPSTTTVVYSCTDSLGATATCRFNIIISVRQTPPTVTGCSDDIILNGPPGATSVQISWIEPTATTSSGLPATVSSTAAPGQLFSIPTNTRISYTFTDPLNQLATSCSFSVILTPTPPDEPPTIVGCPADVQLEANNAETVTVSWTEPTAMSNTGGTVSVTFTDTSGSDFLVPSTTQVEYTFTDSINGRTAQCRFTINVDGQDTIPPMITGCPGNIFLTTNTNAQTQSIVWIEPTATDRGQPILGTSDISPGFAFPVGVQTGVLYEFVDLSGNRAQCAFSVSLVRVDDEPPVITGCPEPISLTAVPGQTVMSITWTEPTATDNFGSQIIVMRSHNPGTQFTVDTSTIITYTFSDAAGNEATCVFTISLTSAPDDPPEIIRCPGDVFRTAPAGAVTLSVTWDEPQATDDNGEVVTIASSTSGDLFVVGTTTSIIYTFMDNAGQTSVCLFNVRIFAPMDFNPPDVFGCPSTAIFERVPTGSDTVFVDWEEPIATDQESLVMTTQTHTPPLLLNVGDTVNVLYTFSDGQNMVTCAFTIFVLPADTSPPVFTNCPEDIVVSPRQTEVGSSVVFWLEPVVTDAISGPVSLAVNFPPGSSFEIGMPVSVIYTATDSAPVPNVETCEFIVLVRPLINVDPIIQSCPGPVTVPVLPGTPSAQAFWMPPTTTDQATFSSTFAPGDVFTTGVVTTVVYTLTDDNQNTAMCSFAVSVIEDGDPPAFQVACPRDIANSYGDSRIEIPIMELWPRIEGVEPFLDVTLTATADPPYPNFAAETGSLPVDGIQRNITYVIADTLTNSQACTFLVTLSVDTGPGPGPSFESCPVGVFTLYGQTNAVVDRIWAPIVATDPSGIPPTLVPIPRDSFIVEMTENFFVEITATNQMQEQAVCVFIVSIIADDIPPTLVCPNDITMTVETDTDTAEVSWDLEVSDDNGMFTLVSTGAQSGDTFGVGTSVISYTATDNALNSASCTFRVIIEVQPLITDIPRADPMPTTCQTGVFTVFTNIPGSQQVVFPPAEALDADGNNLIGVLTTPPTNAFTPGPTPQMITFTFTDSMGLTAICMFELLLTFDDAEPNIIGCPEQVIPGTILPGDTMATVTLPIITAIDNSGSTPSLDVVPPGNVFGVGDTSVEYTFSDNAGNTAICSFTVSVNLDPCDPSPCESGTMCLFDSAAISFIVCTPIGDPCDTLQCFPPSTCTAVENQAVCLVNCDNANCPPATFCLETEQETLCLDLFTQDLVPCMPVCNPGETCLGAVCVQDPVAIIPCVQACGIGETCVQGNCIDPCNPDPCLLLQVCTVVDGAAVCTDPCDPNPCPGNGVCTPTPPTFQCASPDICSTVTCDPRGTCFEATPGLAECGVSCQSPDQNCGALGGFCLDTIADITGFCISNGGEPLECNPVCGAGETCRVGLCIGDPQVIQQCDPACLSSQVCVNNVCTDPCDPSPCPANEVCSANPPSLTPTCTATQGLCSTLSCEPGTTCVEFTNTIARCGVTCSSPLQNCASLETGAVCMDFSGTAICLSGAGNGLLDCNPPCNDGLEACSGGVCFAYPVEIAGRKRRDANELIQPEGSVSNYSVDWATSYFTAFFTGFMLVCLVALYIRMRINKSATENDSDV